MSKNSSIDRVELIDTLIDLLTTLQAKYPEQEICIAKDGELVSCKLGDAVVFEGNGNGGPVITIDAR